MGDVCVDLKTFFDVYPDPLATEDGLESAEFLIEEAVYSPDYVKEHYNVDLQPDTDPSPGIAESRLPDFGCGDRQPAGLQGRAAPRVLAQAVVEPQAGRRVVWANNEILREEDNPYPWLPYVMFGGVPVPGRFWPNCVTVGPDFAADGAEQGQVPDRRERRTDRQPAAVEPATMNPDFKWHNLPGERIPYQPTVVPTRPRVS
jgi:hypothetical protein